MNPTHLALLGGGRMRIGIPFLAMTATARGGLVGYSSASPSVAIESEKRIKFRDGLALTSGGKLPNFSRLLDPGQYRASRVREEYYNASSLTGLLYTYCRIAIL